MVGGGKDMLQSSSSVKHPELPLIHSENTDLRHITAFFHVTMSAVSESLCQRLHIFSLFLPSSG